MRFTLFLFLFPALLQAQNYNRCGTVEYMNQLRAADPQIAILEQSISAQAEQYLNSPLVQSDNVLTIPVVFHILYNTSSENVGDNVVQSALSALNADYSRKNTDSVNTPLGFRPYAVNAQVQFCLAKRTPDLKSTNGIERKFTSNTSWSNIDNMKHNNNDSTSGLDAWDATRYLNIWVGNMAGQILGISTLPGASPFSDGVVVDYQAFGTTGSVLLAKYNKNRTLTHEIGHWLGLTHVWGDDGNSCGGTDSIVDTPNQDSAVYSCPTYPLYDKCTSSGPGIMFMNFMQYTDDGCMNMFSNNQGSKMRAILNTYRLTVINSLSCDPIGMDELDISDRILVYPNPATDILHLHFALPSNRYTIELSDATGKICFALSTYQTELAIPLETVAKGFYVLHVTSELGSATKKVIVY